jgi:CheY-like chemotaxis protein
MLPEPAFRLKYPKTLNTEYNHANQKKIIKIMVRTIQTIRAIIIEDEPLLQESLKQKLSETFPGEMEIVAVCGNAEDALLEIMHRRPDLIFLDIQMPGNDGLWLADHLAIAERQRFQPA